MGSNENADQTAPKKGIVIIGGGIIGSTTAYYLSRHASFNPSRGDTITLLEATKIAGGASGKAGGLLAKWAYPRCIVGLSYRLHKELADKHNGADRWGYRTVHCGQLDTRAVLSPTSTSQSTPTTSTSSQTSPQLPIGSTKVSLNKRSEDALSLLQAAGVPKDLDWVAGEGVDGYEAMGDPTTTAQVHPFDFTTSMAQLAEEKGVRIVYGSASRINTDQDKVASVTYVPKRDDTNPTTETESTLPASAVILTAGPWTPSIYPSIPISALRAHSVTIRPSRTVSPYCLFTSITLPSKSKRSSTTATPEIYPRPTNEVYACGEGDTQVRLPSTSDAVQVDAARCDEIIAQVQSISAELRDGEVLVRQACYLPNVESRKGEGPIIGEMDKVKGLFVGAGHTCWGIQNAPATGLCLSEAVWEGKVRSAEVDRLSPGRFGL